MLRISDSDDESKRLVVTGQARESVRLAREEAEELREPAVRPEHLLLGLLRQEEGFARDALGRSGVSLAAARRAVARLSPHGARGGKRRAQRPPGERLPVASDARAVLEQSLREAVRRGDGHLGVEHLLLALVRDEVSSAVRVLQSFGIAPQDIERALDEAIARAH